MYPILKFGSVQIATFYVVISLSLSLLILLFSKKIEHLDNQSGMTAKQGYDLLILLLFAGFMGGRFFHVFYEEWIYYRSYPAEIFKFWNGGFVYYGGFIFAFIASWIYCRLQKISLAAWADFMTVFVSAAYALGRFGCFFEGCCFGRMTDVSWAIQGRHPTQIYMIVAEFILLAAVILSEKKLKPFPGRLFLLWATFHAATRFIIEFYRDDGRGQFIAGLSISQWISLTIVLLASFVFVYKQLPPKKSSN